MTQPRTAPLGATSHDPLPLAGALRLFALGGLIAALAACAEGSDPMAPESPSVEGAMTAASPVRAADLSSDALDRLVPALEKDAAAQLGGSLRELDATLRDTKATSAAKSRALGVVRNRLAALGAARPDAADLDAMRLEMDDIDAMLRR